MDFVSNLGGIRIYEVVIFGICDKVPAEIVADTEAIIRKNTRKVFETAKATGRFTRDVALELFAPDKSDTPDY